MSSFQREIVTNFFNVGFLKYSGAIFMFAGTIFISRELSPEEYGVYATATIYYGFMQLFLDSGMMMSVVREPDDRGYQQSLWIFSLLIGLFLGGVMCLMAYPLSLWYQRPYLFSVFVFYGLVLFLESLPVVYEGVLSKYQSFKFIAIVGLIATVVQVGLTYLLALQKYSYWSLLAPLALVPLIKYVAYAAKVSLNLNSVRTLPFRKSFDTLKGLFMSMTASRLLSYASRNTDNFILSKIDENILGLYNRAFTFARFPVTIITGVVSSVQLPMFQLLYDKGGDIKKEYISYVHLLGGIGFPVVLMLHLVPFELSELLWGGDWRDVGTYLKPLSILIPTTMILNSTSSMFILFRAEKRLVYNSIISASALILGAVIGSFFSVKGIIVGVIVGNLLGSLPITMYLGFYKTFRFTFVEILWTWWFYYLIVLLLLACYVFELPLIEQLVLATYTIGSIYYMARYYKENYG